MTSLRVKCDSRSVSPVSPSISAAARVASAGSSPSTAAAYAEQCPPGVGVEAELVGAGVPLGEDAVRVDAVLLGLAGVEGGDLRAGLGVHAELVHPAFDLDAAAGERAQHRLGDAGELGQAVVADRPLQAEVAQLVAEHGLVEAAGGLGLQVQLPPVERGPAAVGAAGQVRDQRCGCAAAGRRRGWTGAGTARRRTRRRRAVGSRRGRGVPRRPPVRGSAAPGGPRCRARRGWWRAAAGRRGRAAARRPSVRRSTGHSRAPGPVGVPRSATGRPTGDGRRAPRSAAHRRPHRRARAGRCRRRTTRPGASPEPR